MIDSQIILGALAVGGAWLTKEVASLVLKEVSERRGALKYLAAGRRFHHRVQTSDGNFVEVDNWPTADMSDDEYFDAAFYGSFVNESGRPIIVASINITFWGIDGPRITHSSPSANLNGKYGTVQTIPARTHVNAHFRTAIRGSDMCTYYADTIPVLDVKLSGGRLMHYPLHINFWGDEILRWDSKKNRVMRLGAYPQGFKTKPPRDDA